MGASSVASHPTARVDDTIDHGGPIIDGSPTMTCEGQKVARVGDPVQCDQHGLQTITTGSPTHSLDGRKVARVTSLCSCGAQIVTGSPTFTVD